MSGESSLARVEPEHIKRFRGLMYVIRAMIDENSESSNLKHMSFLLTTISDELADEMKEYDELTIRGILFQIGEVISWIGHGDNERLPEGLRTFAEGIQPTNVIESEAIQVS